LTGAQGERQMNKQKGQMPELAGDGFAVEPVAHAENLCIR
jgi:hypothetical protein